MKIILLFVIIVSAVILTGVILLQESKGSELGAGFGRGAASGLAGQTPAHGATFLTRLTAILAAVFFASTLALSLFVAREDRDDLLETLGAEENRPFSEEREIDGIEFESDGALERADDDIPTPLIEESESGETTSKKEDAAGKIPE